MRTKNSLDVNVYRHGKTSILYATSEIIFRITEGIYENVKKQNYNDKNT